MIKAQSNLEIEMGDAYESDKFPLEKTKQNVKDYDAVMARLAVLKVKGTPVWKLDMALREIFQRYYGLDKKHSSASCTHGVINP